MSKTGRKPLLPMIAAAVAVPVTFAQASIFWMSGDDIQSLLGGKEITGVYASGQSFTERYLDGGRLEYSDNALTLGGHWSIKEGTLCTIYDSNTAGGCYRVTRSEENCFEFYFAARTEAAAPGLDGDKPKWTARGSVSGKPKGCHDGNSV